MMEIDPEIRGILQAVERWSGPLSCLALPEAFEPLLEEEDFVPVQELPEIPKPRVRAARPGKEVYGANYYLSDLLDGVAEFFSDFSILQKSFPDAADLFRKAGTQVVSKEQMFARDLDPAFYNNLPAIGCIFMGYSKLDGTRNDDDTEYAKFWALRKMNRPIGVEISQDAVYEMTTVLPMKGKPLAIPYYVSVGRDGKVKALKQQQTYWHKLTDKKYSQGFTRTSWKHNALVLEMLKKNNKKDKTNLSLDEFSTEIFALIANSTMGSEYGISVRVMSRRGEIATFSIDMLRTPYFFDDREKVVNHNGNTKRILHIVRTHERIMKNGETKFIKSHWRGLRRFFWNTYDVSISLPGKHHGALVGFGAAAMDEEEALKQGVNMLYAAQVGKKIHDHITAPK